MKYQAFCSTVTTHATMRRMTRPNATILIVARPAPRSPVVPTTARAGRCAGAHRPADQPQDEHRDRDPDQEHGRLGGEADPEQERDQEQEQDRRDHVGTPFVLGRWSCESQEPGRSYPADRRSNPATPIADGTKPAR